MGNFKKFNYYAILGVSDTVDADTLKKAYREQVKKYHPDRQPDSLQAEERFKELQEAYTVLKDPEKRNQYDNACRRNSRPGSYKRRAPEKGNSRKKSSKKAKDSENIFEFIKNRMEHRGKRGEDFRYVVSLSFEEAALGVKKVIRIPRRKSCPTCNGLGWEAVGKSPVCPNCRGEGEISVLVGASRQVRVCAQCEGKGILEKTDCNRCKGAGDIPYRVQRTVFIPAGVDNGTRLKMNGEGGKGEKGGGNGDLYIVIQIQDHPVFTRHNLDVHCDIPIRFTQAVLGAEINVPTIRGEELLIIPPGTQSGEVFTLKALGIPGINGVKVGDQKIRVFVEVPVDVTPQEKELLKAWDKISQL